MVTENLPLKMCSCGLGFTSLPGLHGTILGVVHTGVLDRSQIDLSQNRSECERLNAN